MDNRNVICHIIGLNPSAKKIFITKLDNLKYEIIDLDKINKEIFKDYEMDTMFKKYNDLKVKKNERYKDLDKKMTQFWERNFTNLLNNSMPAKKKIILIGQNNHYKQISKKINLPTTNKFLVKTNLKQDVRETIEYNLNNHKKDIIYGCFPINYLDFDYLMKQKQNVNESYIKSGYLLSKKNVNGKGLFLALRDTYNINSKIHPKKNSKIFAYSEPILALLGSFKFDDDELLKSYKKDRVKIKELKEGILKKLRKKRYLYLVDEETFIPHESGNNIKFFSQAPVIVKDKEEIKNVFNMMKEISVFE
jgi:hypothetical protein